MVNFPISTLKTPLLKLTDIWGLNMYQNLFLRQNMQIPQENVYNPITISSLDKNIEDLSKNYEIHKPQEVKEFFEDYDELVQYISSITPLIDKHFPDYMKCLTFCQDPEFEELDDITIYIHSFKSQFDTDWKKLDELEKELFYLDGFSNQTKGLISVDLWLK